MTVLFSDSAKYNLDITWRQERGIDVCRMPMHLMRLCKRQVSAELHNNYINTFHMFIV